MVETGEVSRRDVAYLTDRVLLAEYLLHFEGVEVPESSQVSLECRGCGGTGGRLTGSGQPLPFGMTASVRLA
jgi:hypothetical protein